MVIERLAYFEAKSRLTEEVMRSEIAHYGIKHFDVISKEDGSFPNGMFWCKWIIKFELNNNTVYRDNKGSEFGWNGRLN